MENKLIRRRIFNAYLSSLISISLVLLLIGASSLLLICATDISDYLKENLTIAASMNVNADVQKEQDAEKALLAFPYIKSVKKISREQGMQEMEKFYGEDFLSTFETSTVPVSFEIGVYPKYVNVDSLKKITPEIMNISGMDDVVYHAGLIDNLTRNLRKITLFSSILIALLMFISFVLINNTMRLIIYSKRASVHAMKLVGASSGFIRRPFINKAFLMGLLSSCIASALLVLSLFLLRKHFIPASVFLGQKAMLISVGIIFGSGIFICMVSSYLSIRKLLSLGRDQLYC